jgi:nucleoside-diphosphate-sugar epimerase
MKVLVTGGSGYLGTHVRKFFDADDLSRRSNLNVLNLQDVHVAADYDVVIHLAGRLDKSPEAAEDVFNTNVEGTINVLRQMKRNSIFIFASTKDVYGRFADNHREVAETCPTLFSGQSALEWSKLVAERYVEFYADNRGLRSCTFRLSTVYAPHSEGNSPGFVGYYADAINRGMPIHLPGNGRPRRDLLHVDDFARACKAFIDSSLKHGLYNVGGGKNNALTLRELVGKMEQISGLQAVLNSDTVVPGPVPFNYVTDLTLISQELGWLPSIDLEQGLSSLLNGV